MHIYRYVYLFNKYKSQSKILTDFGHENGTRTIPGSPLPRLITHVSVTFHGALIALHKGGPLNKRTEVLMLSATTNIYKPL